MSITSNANHYWLLIDTPESQTAVDYPDDHSFEHFWWYKDTPLEGSLSASPLWFQVSEAQLDEALEQFPKAIVFQTQADNVAFIEHIKSVTLMLSPTHKPYVVRFYAPTYLEHWLSELPQEHQALLLGPISLIQWRDGDIEHELTNNSPSVSHQERKTPWFQLSEAEWDLLKVAYKKQS
ncbi:DUF4123 domain-containing protein [Vibrio marisflavi]|uniref:DUF4123 domain-containing protein n=1 Tax=Vibrio marisflavi CECT 7928 TaxID=634439 RepID=A0ABM9A1F4_9VIBR|nr:DUF4123 domain-containing protein [Vibrio marisflavi]CAH0537405.1 hypothetical protein VMF7928_01093 [Vibrio marisflavi CECT 7928]